MQLGVTKELPIKQRVVRQDSKSTIVSCLDALVELITNSDDSYRRLEEENTKKSGKIDVLIKRKKGGICTELWLRDYAEGISKQKLQSVLTYGEKSSGIEKYSVRGYFGRGLKQAIIAFGEGEVHSFHNGVYSGIKLWWDDEEEKAQYQEIDNLTDDEKKLLHLGLSPCETLIIIRNKYDDTDYSIPAYDNFKYQLQNHYALRNIFSSDNRMVSFEFQDWKVTRSGENINFIYPAKFKKIQEESVVMKNYHDKLTFVLYECDESFPYEKPTGLSGLILQSKGANLDLKLFSFENDEAAYYFFGTVDCEGLNEQISTDAKNLIDPNRSGLNWRHPYCKEIQRYCEEILKPHIERKRKELTADKTAHISRNKKEILNKLRKLLNDIARDELEDLQQQYKPSSIETLQIFPNYARVQPGHWRTFSIFAPKYIIEESKSPLVKIKSNNYLIYPSENEVELIPHPKYQEDEMYFSTFQVTGDKFGEIGKISCTVNDFEAFTAISVKEPGHIEKPQENKSGGFIKDIIPDLTIDPSQRGRYEEGLIYIYVNFPGTAKYINEDLKGITHPEGQLLLAEIVADSFFRSLVVKKVEKRTIPIIPGKEIEAFNREIYKLQKKYLSTIQSGIMEFVNS